MPLTKICGLRAADAAAACVAVGADFAGLNFVPTSKRCINPLQARQLAAALGPVVPVGVFADQPLDEVVATAKMVGLGWIQLHGGESPDDCARLRAEGLRVIKALDADGLARAATFAPHVDALLVDGRTPGSGAAWDWARVQGPLCAGAPLWLAGGLAPSNVAAAIAAARPSLVDVASGVEAAGRMDPDRVVAFVRAARGELS